MNVMVESRNNPMVGVFRHSPSSIFTPAHLGLKGILYKDQISRPQVLSQLHVTRDKNTMRELPKRNFVTNLRQIPVKVFSASSVTSKSSAPSVTETNHKVTSGDSATRNDASLAESQLKSATVSSEPLNSANSRDRSRNEDDHPVCSICLEAYVDGDEILTLACSHCFHSECVSKWFFHGCLNNADLASSFNCPECRQDHIALSEAASHCSDDRCSQCTTSNTNNELAASFLQIGEKLFQDGGYDFLSDIGSETQSNRGSKQSAALVSAAGGRLTSAPLSPIRASNSALSSAPPRATANEIELAFSRIEVDVSAASQVFVAEMNSIASDRDDSSVNWSTYSDCGYALKNSDNKY